MDDGSTLVKTVPTSVYRYYDEHGVLIYVGVTKRGTKRQTEHLRKAWWPFVASQTVEHFDDLPGALSRESELIVKHNPPFNVALNGNAELHRENYLTFRSAVFTGSLMEAAELLNRELPLFLTRQWVDGTSSMAEYITDARYPILARQMEFPAEGVSISGKYGGMAGTAFRMVMESSFAVLTCRVRKDQAEWLTDRGVLKFKTPPRPRRLERVIVATSLRVVS